jgi:hypothetical protein
MTEEELESPSIEVIKPIRHKVNNIEQKEEAMARTGVTREAYLRVIAEALVAIKRTEYRDAQGNVKYQDSPDVARNQWGAERAAKLFGDEIQHIEQQIKHTHSVEELLGVFNRARNRIDARNIK